MQAIANYQEALREAASRRRSNGQTVTDQDQPEEVFCLSPAWSKLPPLAIVGGMGPLAGALAFGKACARFKDSRAVVLYQACSMPDRSMVILGQGAPNTISSREMALRLAGAVRLASDLAAPLGEPARCIIACNSAHCFWQMVKDDLRQTAARPQMISLVDSSVQALISQSPTRTLLLTTEGARVGNVFSTPLRDAGVAFDELSPALSRTLMKTVYEGVKALDERRTVELGNELFEAILQSGQTYDCLLAGCTELPLTIDLLKRKGSQAVAAFLWRVRVVDPLEEAFRHA